MYLSYKKLWKMLIDKNMTKMELKMLPVSVRLPLRSLAREATSPPTSCSKSARHWIVMWRISWKRLTSKGGASWQKSLLWI
jgi:hypothetical protein